MASWDESSTSQHPQRGSQRAARAAAHDDRPATGSRIRPHAPPPGDPRARLCAKPLRSRDDGRVSDLDRRAPRRRHAHGEGCVVACPDRRRQGDLAYGALRRRHDDETDESDSQEGPRSASYADPCARALLRQRRKDRGAESERSSPPEEPPTTAGTTSTAPRSSQTYAAAAGPSSRGPTPQMGGMTSPTQGTQSSRSNVFSARSLR